MRGSWSRKVRMLPRRRCGSYLRARDLRSWSHQQSICREIYSSTRGALNVRFSHHVSIITTRSLLLMMPNRYWPPTNLRTTWAPERDKFWCLQWGSRVSNIYIKIGTIVTIIQSINFPSRWWCPIQVCSKLQITSTEVNQWEETSYTRTWTLPLIMKLNRLTIKAEKTTCLQTILEIKVFPELLTIHSLLRMERASWDKISILDCQGIQENRSKSNLTIWGKDKAQVDLQLSLIRVS